MGNYKMIETNWKFEPESVDKERQLYPRDVENVENDRFILRQQEGEFPEEFLQDSEDVVLESDLLDMLETLPLGMDEELPNWFKEFFHLYKFNERRKYLMLRQMHLQMIDFEIKKCEILRDIIDKLKN